MTTASLSLYRGASHPRTPQGRAATTNRMHMHQHGEGEGVKHMSQQEFVLHRLEDTLGEALTALRYGRHDVVERTLTSLRQQVVENDKTVDAIVYGLRVGSLPQRKTKGS